MELIFVLPMNGHLLMIFPPFSGHWSFGPLYSRTRNDQKREQHLTNNNTMYLLQLDFRNYMVTVT